MADSSDILCGPCETRHLTEAASLWCTSCDEGLCTACGEHHKVSKASRQHQTIPVSDYIIVRPILSSVRQQCEKHDRRFDFYCIDHDHPCCAMCVPENHKKCNRLKPIEELTSQSKTSAALENIVRGFQELGWGLVEMRQVTNQNLKSLQSQKLDIENKIKTFRGEINKHLDRIESNLLSKLETVCNEQKGQIEKLQSEIKTAELEINHEENCIKSIKDSASTTQIFFATRDLETKLTEKENCVIQMCTLGGAEESSINITINPKLEGLFTDIKIFGEIQLIQKPCKVQVGKWKHKEAQFYLQPVPIARDIDSINLHLIQKIQFDDDCVIRDCCLLSDDKKIFADYRNKNKNLLLYNENGEFVKKIPVSGQPHGLTEIDTDTVAASVDQSVQIIDIDRGVVKKTIKTERPCSGISYYNGHLYVMFEGKGIGQYDMEGNRIRTIKVNNPSSCGYLCVFSTGLCYTSYELFGEKFIVLCDMDGKIKWKSEAGNSGVAVDQSGNVFVTDHDSHELNVISADGKRQKCLLSGDDGLNRPEGVDFDIKKNLLLVVTKTSRSAALYSVT